MFLRKVICVVAASLLLACVASAQEGRKGPKPRRPDLSGSWVTDDTEIHAIDFRGRREPVSPVRLTIEHREPEIKMTRTYILKDRESTAELVYYTDGRGEKNPTFFSGTDESKTKWEGRRLVISGKHRVQSITQDFEEKWELSADGKTLKQTVTHPVPIDGPPSGASGEGISPLIPNTKKVFRRAQ